MNITVSIIRYWHRFSVSTKSTFQLLSMLFFVLLLFVFQLFPSKILAQVSPLPFSAPTLYNNDSTVKIKLHISSITITGNRRTKQYIILREIPFRAGDSLIIKDINELLEQARRQVYNLNLFSEVQVTPVMLTAFDVSLQFKVLEKWYLYPIPQFQLADRNFNEWVNTYNADFDRVIYGLKFQHYNFTGRADQFKVFLLNGYSRNISFSYNTPNSHRSMNEGFTIGSGFTQNREIAYKTGFDNKLLFYNSDQFVRNVFNASITYQKRKGYFVRKYFSLAYNYIDVEDSIISPAYNPNYLNSGKTYVGYPDFSYSYNYINVDNVNYPLDGKHFRISALKRGLGFTGSVNMLSLDGLYNGYYKHFNGKLNSHIQGFVRIKLPFKQPYINQRALGYGDLFLRGQEYYVIDGVFAAIFKYTLRKKLFGFNVPVPFHIKAIPKIPFNFFIKTFADLGYCYNKPEFNTNLNNRLLYTGGFGIDLLTLYDVNIKLEYSFNQLGENGLFLHAKGGF